MPAVTPDPIAKFFDELGGRGHEPLLGKATGSARFDVVDGKRTERWLLTHRQGRHRRVASERSRRRVVRADRASFDRIVGGKMNLMAAVLRGEVAVQGDPRAARAPPAALPETSAPATQAGPRARRGRRR